jgi:hypothetical protein
LISSYLQYQSIASAYLFEGLIKTIKENQAKKEQKMRKKREQSIKELRIPSHSFFMASTFFKLSGLQHPSAPLPQLPEHGELFPPSGASNAQSPSRPGRGLDPSSEH